LRRVSILKRVAVVFVVLLLGLVGFVAWKLRSRAEEIPKELPPIDAAVADPQAIVIPGGGGLPELKIADLKGKTAYLVVEDRESMQARESKTIQRALNRWSFPADVVGYNIGDAEGFELLSSKIEEFLAHLRKELRLPLYIDYKGVFLRTFKLPRGHVGVVVLGPDGAPLLRHSGPMTDAQISELRALLRAEEPAPPPAPAFELGGLDNAACKGKACLFVFLAEPVKKADVPGVEGGYGGDMEASAVQGRKPSVRLAGMALESDAKLDPAKVQAVLVGEVPDLGLTKWTVVPAAPEARAAFELPEGEAGLVVVDPEGRLAVREPGTVPLYKFGRVSDLIGVDLGDPRE
jgi:hypothetical protein